MKLITAVIDDHKLTDVKDALAAFGVSGLTVSQASGRQNARRAVYRGTELTVDLAPRTRIEVVCDLFDADDIAGVIVAAAGSGERGGGKLWISEVDRIVRIRTGEVGIAAL